MWPQATSDQGRQGARRRSAEIVEATRDVFKFDNGLMLWAGNKLHRARWLVVTRACTLMLTWTCILEYYHCEPECSTLGELFATLAVPSRFL